MRKIYIIFFLAWLIPCLVFAGGPPTPPGHIAGGDTSLGVLGTKNPPIDADKAVYRDSTASDAVVTSTWTQIKAFLKTYFDTVYAAVLGADDNYVTDAEKVVIGNTSGTNSGNETTTTIGTLINGATAKTAPVDADYLGLMDSEATNILKKLSWAYVKSLLWASPTFTGLPTFGNGATSSGYVGFLEDETNGTKKVVLHGPEDVGAADLDIYLPARAGTVALVQSLTPVIDDPDNFAANFAGTNLYGGTFIANAAGTAVLPDPAVGMNFTYVLEGANANIIDPLGTGTADTIYMNGLAAAGDENITSSTSGAICTFQYRAADTWMATCNGFAEATPP